MHKLTYFLLLSLLLSVSCNETQTSKRYEPHGVELRKKIYKVGIHPYLNSKKMFVSYRPILDYLESKLDNVEFFLETSKDYPAYDKKLYARAFAFSLPNPFQTYNSLKHGYRVIAKMKPDSVFRGIFVARKDRKLKSVTDLRGEAVSFPAPTALAATMMPLYYLYENGLDINREITQKFVGSQYSSILNAYSGDTVVGATWPPPWEAWSKENPQKAAKMEVVWQTKPLINNGFVVRDDIDSTLAQKVLKLLTTLDQHDYGKKMLERAGFEGFEEADNTKYSVVQQFLDKYNQAKGVTK
ncbi:MAG: phosphate/phosphite/phosphonate ABC transporter substrate-binding protein [Campylobacterota bacterium]|nr:phosphate/phosphite/phosphonate ABC transporter substrate-binding protein [Campylobacterota bacterium]